MPILKTPHYKLSCTKHVHDNLTSINLHKANLAGAQHPKIILCNADMAGVDSSNADMRNTSAQNANMGNVNSSENDCEGANLTVYWLRLGRI